MQVSVYLCCCQWMHAFVCWSSCPSPTCMCPQWLWDYQALCRQQTGTQAGRQAGRLVCARHTHSPGSVRQAGGRGKRAAAEARCVGPGERTVPARRAGSRAGHDLLRPQCTASQVGSGSSGHIAAAEAYCCVCLGELLLNHHHRQSVRAASVS